MPQINAAVKPQKIAIGTVLLFMERKFILPPLPVMINPSDFTIIVSVGWSTKFDTKEKGKNH
jgi:hypothetical protein